MAVMMVVAVFTAVAFLGASSERNITQPIAVEPPLAGMQVESVNGAEEIVGYKILSPQSLPESFALQEIRVVKEVGLVYLIFGAQSIAAKSPTFSGLISGGYWIFIQSPQELSIGEQQAAIDGTVSEMDGMAAPVTVGGSPGFIVCPGNVNNHLVWWRTGIHYELVTPLDATHLDMVGFAESVPLS